MSDLKNQYINTARTVEIGNPSWQLAQDSGLTDLSVRHVAGSRMVDHNGHSFMNMCSCSYLGLEIDPRLAQRAAAYVLQSGTVNLPTSRIRIRLKELNELEQAISAQFKCSAFTATSCSAGIVASLPLLAAGIFTDAKRPFSDAFLDRAAFIIIQADTTHECREVSTAHVRRTEVVLN